MIVPVKRVKIFTLEENKDKLLLALQSKGIMMLAEKVDKTKIDTKYEDEIIDRSTSVLKKISEYKNKKKFFEYNTVEYNDFVNESPERIKLLEKLESKINILETKKDENINHIKEIKNLKPFNQLKYLTKDLKRTKYVSFYTGYISDKDLENVEAYLNENNIEHEFLEASDFGHPIVFVLEKGKGESILNTISGIGYNDVDLPELEITIADEIHRIEEKISDNEKEIQEIQSYLSEIETEEIEIKLLLDQMHSKKERMFVKFESTESTVYLDGWVREDKIEELETLVSGVVSTYDIDIRNPHNNEEVPTALENNKFVHQFETITNMFSVPNYREIDPNPVMSIWYWLIFGIMMGDIGYGLAMVIIFGLFIKLKKPKGSLSQLVHVLYYSGYTSILAGIAFGSFFGKDFDLLNLINKNWHSTIINPIDEPLTMLIFSIILGAFHLISGLILKMRVSIKQNDIPTALADGLSWILILSGGGISVLGFVLDNSFNNVLKYGGLSLVGLGILLILVLAGREKKNIFSKAISGIGGLASVTDYLSDLLSYSRILALSLSTAVIAFTMNTLAELVQVGVVGIIFSIIIYIIGHTFNFAMGLLSAYVHDSRLQYIEFFNKFYEGGGEMFEPLSFKTEHIDEIKN